MRAGAYARNGKMENKPVSSLLERSKVCRFCRFPELPVEPHEKGEVLSGVQAVACFLKKQVEATCETSKTHVRKVL